MSLAWSELKPLPAHPAASIAPVPPSLAKLVYRSRAVRRLAAQDLYKLARDAQSRNRAESITGLVLYDDDRFFQWLEGPADSLARIMQSIYSDPRHADIEVLENRPTTARVFGDWSMKLISSDQSAGLWHGDVVEPPSAMIAQLRRSPKTAPVILAALMPIAPVAPEPSTSLHTSPRAAVNGHAAAVLKSVFIETVIPELRGRHGLAQIAPPSPLLQKRVIELANLLISSDQTATMELIREVQADRSTALVALPALFEPAARRLGDLWGEDICTEFDVTLGLSRMQSAVRLLSADALNIASVAAIAPAVLVVPEPGELHALGVSLSSDALWGVGWNPKCEYPSDDHALEDLVAATWFDVLDLSLSTAFSREDWLPRLKKSVTRARQASRNPALLVIVGGRLFADNHATKTQVGADLAATTATNLDQTILIHQQQPTHHQA
jgi:methanogenic corrinoid protein MtbC1